MIIDFTKRLAQITTGDEVFVVEGPDYYGDYVIRYADGERFRCYPDGRHIGAPFPCNIRQATPEDIARWDAPEPAPLTDEQFAAECERRRAAGWTVTVEEPGLPQWAVEVWHKAYSAWEVYSGTHSDAARVIVRMCDPKP